MANTRQVALLVNAATPHDRKNIRGVADYAQEVGNWALYVDEDPVRKLPELRTWPGDGIIANLDRRLATAVRGLRIPVVQIGGGYGWGDPTLGGAHFRTDDRAVGRLAAEHLLDRGFIRLAYCGLPPDPLNLWVADRAEAFKQRAEEAGCPCSIHAGRRSTMRKWADLQHELAAWLESLEKPVGLMACNDARALHVLEACRTIGAKVPDDVTVIGVDNDELMCELANPPLSSVEQGARRMGYHAAAALDRLMNGQPVPQLTFLVEPEGVVTRRSTDALVIEDAAVAAAVRFIREHACETIDVRHVVKVANVSRSTLQARFRSVLGRTIHTEIQRVRIERAKRLVATTDLPLKQIAIRVGFKHVQYLTTLFRQRTGQTPAEYRRRKRI